jgi:hypothetical protein
MSGFLEHAGNFLSRWKRPPEFEPDRLLAGLTGQAAIHPTAWRHWQTAAATSSVGQVVPMVIETTNRGERAYDIYSLLFKERIVFVGTPIDDMVASLLIAQLLYLASEDSDRDIMMYINSPGGHVNARAGRLRHHAADPAGRLDDLCRNGGQHGCGALGGRRQSEALHAA